MRTATEKFSEFATRLTYDRLPGEVRTQVKKLILDTIGCCIGGASTPWSRVSTQFVLDEGGSAEATVICEGQKVPADYAMMANGALAHSLDFDDVHHSSALHIAGVIAPAAIATAEKLGSTGKDIITAFAAGFDVQHRIGMALDPVAHYAQGFHPTCTTGPFGSAVTVGKLYGLDHGKMVNALGIAGSTSSGLEEVVEDGTWTERFHSGLAAYHGSLAAKLARLGYTGPRTIIEGKRGFLRGFTTNPRPHELDKELGDVFEVMNTQIKLYACCGTFQSPIDVLLTLMEKHRFNAEDVEEIKAGVGSDFSATHPYDPVDLYDAQMSLPISLAIAAFERKVSAGEFTMDNVSREEVKAFARKVTRYTDPEVRQEHIEDPRKLGVILNVKLKNGTTFNERQSFPPDGPGNWAPKKVEEKFLDLASPVIGDAKATQALDLLMSLEEAPQITDITKLFRPT
ncbi:MmgE/PrpD family protein (plasmid) [Bosea sp. F3-2]|uniref:MmgE/PrpD family protein n=1 Tax=Bosea sp. F3-2 TaxID=2599640 RepID=UPI0011EF6393|nr:MmgE/PrpD family protein [Bosea sp. F3-2]QEL27354.1 MmgE/PrpD family protein [Bosea sp. F3-2]